MDGINIDLVKVIVLTLLLARVAWHDFKFYKITNSYILIGLVIGVLLSAWQGGFIGVGWSLKGFAVGLVLLLPLYWLRAMGAGDVKLMAMVGSYLGPVDVVGALLATFLVGGVLAIALAWHTKKLKLMLCNIKFLLMGGAMRVSAAQMPVMDELSNSAGKLPYGIAIALGTLGFLIWQKI